MSKVAKLDRRSIPVLKEWVSLPDAGARLRLTRQRLFQMVDENKWKTLHQIPGKPSDDPEEEKRPALLVVRLSEVEAMLAAQKAAGGCPACAGVSGDVNVPAEKFCPEHKPQASEPAALAS
jgi:hypothetical protein